MFYNVADVLLGSIIVLSVVVSFWRGFFKEVLILSFFLASLFIANKFGAIVGGYCTFVSMPLVQDMIGYFLVFSACNIIGGLARIFLIRMLQMSTTAMNDRVVGIGFGVARGLLGAGVLVYGLSTTNIVNTDAWQESLSIPHINEMNEYIIDAMPKKMRNELYAKLGLTQPKNVK